MQGDLSNLHLSGCRTSAASKTRTRFYWSRHYFHSHLVVRLIFRVGEMSQRFDVSLLGQPESANGNKSMTAVVKIRSFSEHIDNARYIVIRMWDAEPSHIWRCTTEVAGTSLTVGWMNRWENLFYAHIERAKHVVKITRTSKSVNKRDGCVV